MERNACEGEEGKGKGKGKSRERGVGSLLLCYEKCRKAREMINESHMQRMSSSSQRGGEKSALYCRLNWGKKERGKERMLCCRPNWRKKERGDRVGSTAG